MTARPPRLPPSVKRELEGLTWELVPGRKHWHLRVENTLVAIWPHGTLADAGPHNHHMVRSAIRKFKTWKGTTND